MREFNLPENCTVVSVRGLHRQLTELAASQSDVSLNASNVTAIDAASLQTLTAFLIAQNQSGKKTVWTGCSATFTDAVSLLGLKEQLGLL